MQARDTIIPIEVPVDYMERYLDKREPQWRNEVSLTVKNGINFFAAGLSKLIWGSSVTIFEDFAANRRTICKQLITDLSTAKDIKTLCDPLPNLIKAAIGAKNNENIMSTKGSEFYSTAAAIISYLVYKLKNTPAPVEKIIIEDKPQEPKEDKKTEAAKTEPKKIDNKTDNKPPEKKNMAAEKKPDEKLEEKLIEHKKHENLLELVIQTLRQEYKEKQKTLFTQREKNHDVSKLVTDRNDCILKLACLGDHKFIYKAKELSLFGKEDTPAGKVFYAGSLKNANIPAFFDDQNYSLYYTAELLPSTGVPFETYETTVEKYKPKKEELVLATAPTVSNPHQAK